MSLPNNAGHPYLTWLQEEDDMPRINGKGVLVRSISFSNAHIIIV